MSGPPTTIGERAAPRGARDPHGVRAVARAVRRLDRGRRRRGLLLDEPSEALAPLVVDHLGEQIARLKAEGLTILLAEQNTEFSLRLADRVYVLEKGAIRFSGAAAALRDNEALRHELLAL